MQYNITHMKIYHYVNNTYNYCNMTHTYKHIHASFCRSSMLQNQRILNDVNSTTELGRDHEYVDKMNYGTSVP